MNAQAVNAFFSMGGYALYVWGSLGMCAVVMALELWQLRLRRHQLLRLADPAPQAPESTA
jgi:heme exporter protein D